MNEKIHPVPAVSSLEDVPVLLLVGGMGTRLRSVLTDKPKPLAQIGSISFLELLVLQLHSQGLRNLVMCTGFQASQIQEKFGNGHKWGVSIGYSEETSPLGTAGAIKLAERLFKQALSFVVMNGDSFLELDFHKLLQFHKKVCCAGTIAVRRVPDAARYGTVVVNHQNRIIRFSEKMGIAKPGLINGGVYVLDRSVLHAIPNGQSSLEKDILPGLLNRGVFAFEQNGLFIDIGTPEDYARAQSLYESLSQAAAAAESRSESSESRNSSSTKGTKFLGRGFHQFGNS